MAKKKPTWNEKLNDSKGLPKVEEITDAMSKRWGAGTLVIPAPIEVDEIMRKVPEGKLVTINEIRAALARKHDNWHLRVGCSSGSGRAKAARLQGCYALLAYFENWRVPEREVSRWNCRAERAFGAGRAQGDAERQKLRCSRLPKITNSNLRRKQQKPTEGNFLNYKR
jgi:hypothetical protein